MANAQGFVEGLAKFGAVLDALAVDAMKRFAVRASEKVVDYSPVAKHQTAHRGMFRGNWRLRLTGTDRVVFTVPDPTGSATKAAMERTARGGPSELNGWADIRISNPHPAGESIEREHRVLARSADELQMEAR